MPAQITVQLYSVRDLATKDYEATIRAIAEIGFGCVETAGFPGSSPEKAAKVFKELGISAPSGHCGLPIGENKNEVIETALLLGHKYVITGCPPNFRDSFTSLDKIKATADLYCEAAENVKSHGLQIGYHNHDWDLAEIDGQKGYQVFLANVPESVIYEADIFWVAKAGLDPVSFINEIGNRGKCLHFKDGIYKFSSETLKTDTQYGQVVVSPKIPFLPAGTGQIDLQAAAKAATHAEYIAVELDEYSGDIMNAIRESYTYLTTNGIAKGKI